MLVSYGAKWTAKSFVCPLSSLVEHFLGKEEVVGPIPTGGSVLDHSKPDEVGAGWLSSSVGESARLIIVRSRVRIPPQLPSNIRVFQGF